MPAGLIGANVTLTPPIGTGVTLAPENRSEDASVTLAPKQPQLGAAGM